MRYLASIQKITRIVPIKNADHIELADVLGWHVVVERGKFSAGDEKWDPEEKGLDKNLKVQATRKWYTKFSPLRWFYKKFLQKKLYTDFPSDIVCKTGEMRVQVMQDILDEYKGMICYYTEKLDGSSITFWLENIGRAKKERLRVCSQNKEILDKNNFMYKAAEKLIPCLRNLPERAIFQGEIVGPGIQGNKYGLSEHRIFVFQIYNRGYHSYIQMDTMFAACKTVSIDTVPLLGKITLGNNIDDLVKLAEGKSKLNPKIQREGIVVRPIRDIYRPDFARRFVNDRVSFKVINPKFLLKYED